MLVVLPKLTIAANSVRVSEDLVTNQLSANTDGLVHLMER